MNTYMLGMGARGGGSYLTSQFVEWTCMGTQGISKYQFIKFYDIDIQIDRY